MLVSHLHGLSTQAAATCSSHPLCRPRAQLLLLLVMMNLNSGSHSPMLGRCSISKQYLQSHVIALKTKRG